LEFNVPFQHKYGYIRDELIQWTKVGKFGSYSSLPIDWCNPHAFEVGGDPVLCHTWINLKKWPSSLKMKWTSYSNEHLRKWRQITFSWNSKILSQKCCPCYKTGNYYCWGVLFWDTLYVNISSISQPTNQNISGNDRMSGSWYATRNSSFF